MRKTRFSEAKIVEILKEHDATGKTAEICRRHGIHPNTLRNWKAKYGGLERGGAGFLNRKSPLRK